MISGGRGVGSTAVINNPTELSDQVSIPKDALHGLEV